MSVKVAVVTGSNKGIGFGIVRELLRRGVGTVYLTSRDVNKGKEAVDKLKTEGLEPLFHQLDVTDKASIKQFADYIQSKHDSLDILINNAGVVVQNFKETTYEDSKRVIETNYRSILYIEEYLFPILNDNARVINVSSDLGHITNIKNPFWIQRLTKKDINKEEVSAFVDWFLEAVRTNTVNETDFAEMPLLAYRISKVALCALTRAQQNEMGSRISVNSIHPGFVKTDMTKGFGALTVDEAGKASVYLALDVDQSVKGRYFWFDKTEKEWTDTTLDLVEKIEDLEKNFSFQL